MSILTDEDCNFNAYLQIPASCNSNCEYCSTKYSRMGKLALSRNAQDWAWAMKRLSDERGPVYFAFAFGEPFSSIDLVQIMGQLSESNIIDCMTNMVVTVKMIEEYFNEPGNARVGATYHPHLWNDLDDFIKETNKLREIPIGFINIFILGHPKHLSGIIEWKNRIKSETDAGVYVTPFYGSYDNRQYPDNYTDEEDRIINDCLIQQYGKNLIKKENKICSAGVNNIYIDWHGDVRPCYAHSIEPMGNIFSGYKLYSEARVCSIGECVCPDMWRYIKDD